MRASGIGVRIVVALAALIAAPLASAQEAIDFTVGRGGDGNAMRVVHDGNRTEVTYSSRENGRGPAYHETLTIGADGLPVSWTIEGNSLFGAPVKEHFERTGGRVVWSSQAEEGDQPASGKQLYIVNDGSPYALGVYARALRDAPGQRLTALPYGELSLTEVGRTKGKVDGKTVELIRYRIDGLDVQPSFVTLDAKGALIAAGSAVRAGYGDLARSMGRGGEDDLADAYAELAHRHADAPVEIRNVRIFDPEAGALTPLSTVVTWRGRITRILPYDPAAPMAEGSHIIDGDGGTLVSGLHDMHAHLRGRGGLFYIAAGVTGVRDQGNGKSLLDLMARIDSHAAIGPRVVPNLFLEGESPYSSHAGFLPKTLKEAFELINWAADRGYFQIKIYNSMNPEWVPALAAEAHRVGMGVTGHVPAFTTPDAMIEAGYNDIAHINQLMLGWVLKPGEDTRTPLRLTGMSRLAALDLDSDPVRHTIKLMQDHKVALDTTSVIVERLMLSRPRFVQPGDAAYLDHFPVAYQRYRRRSFVPLEAPGADAEWKEAWQRVLQTMKLLHDNGIQLLPGTDDATGVTVHREVELYVEAGIPPAEALRLATLDAERYMRRDADYGSIERGKASDFFLIPGDPLTDISAIRRIKLVMQGDTIFYPEEIYTYLGVRPFEAPPKVLQP